GVPARFRLLCHGFGEAMAGGAACIVWPTCPICVGSKSRCDALRVRRTPGATTRGRRILMALRSDALVFFGATGDLAAKQIFPALQAMADHDQLTVPVIGVAGRPWSADQLRARAAESLKEHGHFDETAFARLAPKLDYIGGDYDDARTYQRLRDA